MAFKTIITCDYAGCTAQFELPHEVCNTTTEDVWEAAESAGWGGLELDFCPLHSNGYAPREDGFCWPGKGYDAFNEVLPEHVAHLLKELPGLLGVYDPAENVFALPGWPEPQIVSLYDDGQFADLRDLMEHVDSQALVLFLEAELAKHLANIEAGTETVRLKPVSR